MDFDPDITSGVNANHVARGQAITDPDYRARAPGEMRLTDDYGVVVLDDPQSLSPAALPTLDQLDQMAAHNGLRDVKFTAVGYGTSTRNAGMPSFSGEGVRRFAVQGFFALDPLMLHLDDNAATGNGGTCYGDSGGPNFIGDTNVIAAITSMGDFVCQASSVAPRMDIAAARSFVEPFLGL